MLYDCSFPFSIIQKDINNGGRGLNLVVVDSHRMQAVHARRFDTYASDSNELELFLLREVREGDILIAVTFDEASRNLGASAKNLIAELGEFLVYQNGHSVSRI